MEDIDTKEEAVFDFGHWSGDQEGHIRRELPLIRPRNPVQPREFIVKNTYLLESSSLVDYFNQLS